MNRVVSSAVGVAGLVFTLSVAASWAGPAPNNDPSDNTLRNTAGGTSALQSPSLTGLENTAFGYWALLNNTSGYDNTAFGDGALLSTTAGNLNTASGAGALELNTTGSNNTAGGAFALYRNTEGTGNTASGESALRSNTTGDLNTASGDFALSSNTTGSNNTASGAYALYSTTTGSNTTASGAFALYSTTSGIFNTASGAFTLYSTTAGHDNTASGAFALYNNTTGGNNTASGDFALFSNTTGAYNTALGYQALDNSTGSRNLALGYNAGFKLSSGDKNIYVGNSGVASESNTIRLGQAPNQTRTFIAGIYGAAVGSGSPKAVYINSNGQLGTSTQAIVSSARYKRDITDMGARSQGLHQLRPVTFRYKQDPQGQRQYGLIAEEVAKVYPELVVRGAKGEVESVQYHELIPMLLNEVQHQQQEIGELKAQTEEQRAQNAALAARLERLEAGAVPTATRARP